MCKKFVTKNNIQKFVTKMTKMYKNCTKNVPKNVQNDAWYMYVCMYVCASHNEQKTI